MTYAMQVSVPYFTNVPEDVVTNTWHFDWLGGGAPNAASFDLCMENVRSFYGTAYSGIASVGNWANYMSLTGAVIKMYNLADPKPRVPVRTWTGTMPGAKDNVVYLPTEVACVLSYHTEYVSGVSKASQRGRLYMGGLGAGWLAAGGASAFPSLLPTARTALGNSASTLCAASLTDDWGWVVYSPKLGDSFAVAGGWVDNAFDTQRRRGQAATARTLWTD